MHIKSYLLMSTWQVTYTRFELLINFKLINETQAGQLYQKSKEKTSGKNDWVKWSRTQKFLGIDVSI